MTDEQLLLDAAKAEQEGVTSEHNQYTSLLIRRYMPMIKAKASCFKNSRVESDDLVSEGFLGLLSAIKQRNAEAGGRASFRKRTRGFLSVHFRVQLYSDCGKTGNIRQIGG